MQIRKSLLILGLLITGSSFAKTVEKFKTIESKTLSAWIKAKTADLYVVDANNDKTRKEYGTVPGAKLLNSYDKYNVATNLPQKKDSKLVFFCANEQCMASHKAAEKALASGYTQVYVMTDGIMGWKKNGFPRTTL